MLFYFTLPLMDHHLAEMEITNKNAASGGGTTTDTAQSSKMLLTNNNLMTKKG